MSYTLTSGFYLTSSTSGQKIEVNRVNSNLISYLIIITIYKPVYYSIKCYLSKCLFCKLMEINHLTLTLICLIVYV